MRIFHGLLTGVLLASMLTLAVRAIALDSIVLAVVYVAVAIAAFTGMVAAVCTKCECRLTACGHLLPGPLTRFLPPRAQTPYTTLDWSIVTAAALLLVGPPQYWLARDTTALVTFWVLGATAAVDVRLYVCARCGNRLCPMCKNASRPASP
jgi:hypothetical protein